MSILPYEFSFLYRQPYGALGDVDIMWLPLQSSISGDTSEVVKLWIWVHPSAHSHVVETLTAVYELTNMTNTHEAISVDDGKVHENEEKLPSSDNFVIDPSLACSSVTSDMKTDNDSSVVSGVISVKSEKLNKSRKRKREEDSVQVKKKLKTVNEMKLSGRNVPFERTPKYCSSSSRVSLTLLKDTLNRFRLTGPEVLNVLKAAFIPANVHSVEDTDEDGVSKDKCWWRDYYNDEAKTNCHQNQAAAFKKLSYSHLEKRTVLPLTIRDPRMTLPKKKTPIIKESKGNYYFVIGHHCCLISVFFLL